MAKESIMNGAKWAEDAVLAWFPWVIRKCGLLAVMRTHYQSCFLTANGEICQPRPASN